MPCDALVLLGQLTTIEAVLDLDVGAPTPFVRGFLVDFICFASRSLFDFLHFERSSHSIYFHFG